MEQLTSEKGERMEIEGKWLIVALLMGILVGEILFPFHFVWSLLAPSYLTLNEKNTGKDFTVILKNKEDYATKMMYAITADSESIKFNPSNDTTDTISPNDQREKDFQVAIDNGAGSYTFVVHAYVLKGSNWYEVYNVTKTLEK